LVQILGDEEPFAESVEITQRPRLETGTDLIAGDVGNPVRVPKGSLVRSRLGKKKTIGGF